jgi:hypothetical protein
MSTPTRTTLKPGDKARTVYGEIVTVLSVDEYTGIIRVNEGMADYHPTKIYPVQETQP